MLVAFLDAGTEYIVMADFVCKVFPVGLFVFPVPAEQTGGENGRILVLAPVFLNFDKLVGLLDEHVIGGDALGILEKAEEYSLGPAVMIRERLERRTQAAFKFIAGSKDVYFDGFVGEYVGTFATVT